MFSTSSIELSKSALQNNVRFILGYLHPGCRFSSVIKGNAYGHGIDLYVPLAEECGIDHFSVFTASEAWLAHKKAGTSPVIMVMGMMDEAETGWAVNQGVQFYVSSPESLQMALRISVKIRKKAHIHLEVETGMNRTGIEYRDLKKVAEMLKRNHEHFCLEGLCTHFAGAESIANYHRIQHQKKTFRKMLRRLEEEGIRPPLCHTACSAAALRYPETQMDMVRMGILQYGFFPTREILIDYMVRKKTNLNPVQRVLTWRTRVMGLKKVKKGSFVGYGTSYLASNDMVLASIPVGYAQGFSRSMSNRGHVLIRGERSDVVGMVNMNMMLTDVSHIPGVETGDEVVLVGKQGDQEITVASFGEISEQVNYELLTRLPENIPRKITE